MSPDFLWLPIAAVALHLIEEFVWPGGFPERLQNDPFQLEEIRTRELVLRHAAKPPARVLDVGGAAGAYAFWLAERVVGRKTLSPGNDA